MIGLVIDGLMEENDLAPPSSKKEIRSPPSPPPIQKVPNKFEIFPAPSSKT